MQADTLQVVVRRRRQQGENVVVLDLAGVDDAALPPFEAGAHVDVHLPSGLVRQYSLCGDPADRRAYRLGVLRDAASRGGSQAVHEVLGEGVQLAISRPRNHFPLVAGARHSVLVGGGIGITPMIAMAHALAAAGASFELHYCLRSPSSGGFVDELKAAPFADRVSFHFSVGGGRIDPAAVLDRCGREGTQLYVCGPAGFMDAVMEAAALPKAQMHRELFGAEVDTSGGGFEVVAQASGKTVSVAPGQTIVAALAGIGIRIEVSCQEGVCGTCVCTVLEGECDHRDVYLTEDEREAHDQIMACCSRARSSRLVLDV
ncbi:PDR/VanB family oxidoreductase [Paucibacter sp. R3-3]|uniref:PDR/VanB family oxidoreductase n=1 Tax=Roseateles agri TaxID=3098619 RepID=A0ABU5DHH3_9BURK|nr:PDR/VanB family oxidoreductase [Paucibacter sp. R3-3]MDY0745246.1 PDR/VanB family oxidoreductase [Paucibacter sp. R3-3]